MNNLSKEKSPYLKEAAHQPVNWHPWCDEAFQEAKKQNKPILLDIGASWCHWCHVIDRESYEDKKTAEIINKNFIAIKVDRDERPDLDKIYQEAAQILSGTGGWPLTVFLTPEEIPFYAGTYFPPVERYGMPSFKTVLESISRYYHSSRQDVNSITKKILTALSEQASHRKIPEREIINHSVLQLLNNIDIVNGGFGTSPKFPNSGALLFLLDMYAETNDKDIIDAITLTLTRMSQGGFYDQLAGGFHRYSTDEEWKVPHFEKMLEDNAMLLEVYLHAYKLTKNSLFKKIAEEILQYISREMLDENGFFYSSQDADTNHEEGEHYTWTKQEIKKILDEKEAKIISLHYGISETGEIGNVLYVKSTPKEIAEYLRMPEKEVFSEIESAKQKLLIERQKREKPFLDKTLYTNWNALMINSFFTAYKILHQKECKETALKALEFILQNLIKNETLYHMHSESEAQIDGFLDDYQFLISALISAFEIASEKKYLDTALSLMDSAIKKFEDKLHGGFFYAEKNSHLIKKDKPFIDTSTPSGNSISAINLIKLSALTENISYMEKAEKTLMNIQSPIEPLYYAAYLRALNLYYNQPIVIKIQKGENFQESFLKEIFSIKNSRIIISYLEEESKQLAETRFFICTKGTCSKPINSVEEIIKHI